MNPIPIIIVWVILFFVIIGYAVYRLFTDKGKEGKKHFLYPLVSNPNDPIFPKAKNKLEWTSYIAFLLSFLGLIIFGIIENGDLGETQSLTAIYFTNAMFLTGIVCIVIPKVFRKK